MPRSLLALVVLILATAAHADDITVTTISRLPDIDYVWGSSNPTRDGWPADGAQIMWRANVMTWAAHDVPNVGYRWTQDGREIARGTVTLKANANTTIDLPWTWTFTRHRLAFDIDALSGEESTTNNHLEIFTDALSVGFWVEQSLYDYFRANQGKLGAGSTCWENWAQRQIALYNDMAANAVYPETPHGVLDRWRIQKIVVVPDGALPLVPVDLPQRGDEYPVAATHPDASDRSVDLEWGFRASSVTSYGDTHTISATNPFYLAPVLIHELGHARYLVDIYSFDVQQAPPAYSIDITDNGAPIAGTVMAVESPYVYRTPELGLMNRSFTFIDRYSAAALNRIAGARATTGNYNEPENIGVFLNDLPVQNEVTIRDPNGDPIADADVEIFQSQLGHADAWYATEYDDTPDLTLHTDANGRVLVGRCPFSADGKVVHTWRGSNAVAIVRAKQNGHWRYGFLEARQLNLESWRGHAFLGQVDVVVGRDTVCSTFAPLLFAPSFDAKLTTADVTLRWNAVPGATSYVVWAAAQGGVPQRIGSTTETTFFAHLPGRVYWWVEAQLDGCPATRSESSRFTAPIPPWRRAAR